MTFPIISRGGGVCACEASAGGRVSRVGARFTQVWPRSFVRENRGRAGDLLPLFYLGEPTSAYRKAAHIP